MPPLPPREDRRIAARVQAVDRKSIAFPQIDGHSPAGASSDPLLHFTPGLNISRRWRFFLFNIRPLCLNRPDGGK